MQIPKYILPIIVLAQFCCISIWFAGNGVMGDLVQAFNLPSNALGHLTSAVQFGFISGTLVFAFFTIADRFSPSKVFLVSALAGAFFNLGTIWEGNTLTSLLGLRFVTGFCLAGIYPVGMKIAADYFDKGLGKSLGYLVGALVLGTAFPHLLKDFSGQLPWRAVIVFISSIASFGGIIIWLFVPDGPFRKAGTKPDFNALFEVFKNSKFRAAAFGYFGHMWELYAFWAFVPMILVAFNEKNPEVDFNVSLLSFFIIGIGGIACVIGGYISAKIGTKKTAFFALLMSGICCLISPLIFNASSEILLVVFLLFWGAMVIADSPLFSTLVAQNAPPEKKGTALTIVNCVGFSITIFSIQLINFLFEKTDPTLVFVVLAVGPVLGLIALGRKKADLS